MSQKEKPALAFCEMEHAEENQTSGCHERIPSFPPTKGDESLDVLNEQNPSIYSNNSSMDATSTSGSHERISSFPPTEGAESLDVLNEENPSIYSNTSSMDASSENSYVGLTEKIERIQSIFGPMTLTFVNYFKPQEITKLLQNLDEEESHGILKQSVLDGSGGMQLLMEEVLNVGGELIFEFYSVVTMLDEDKDQIPAFLLSGEGMMKREMLSHLMKFIIQIVEHRKADKLTATDLTKIAATMVKEKLMLLKKSTDDEKPVESLKYLLTLVKKSKPDWPFRFMRIVHSERPDLFSLDFPEISSKNSENLPNDKSEARAEMAPIQSSFYHQLHVKPKDVDSPGLNMLIESGALHPKKITTQEVKEPVSKQNAWNKKVSHLSDGEEEDEENEETERKISVAPSSLDVDLKMREYQKELAKAALEGQNTIICAPTGCGKTRVALEIIIKHLNGGSESTQKKVCFFARTVPLAVQQHTTIRKYLPTKYKTNIFTGDSELSSTMHLLLEDLHVVVLTPMILMNHIKRGNIDGLQVFSLLIFDECHHTREKEPYNYLMCLYLDKKLKGDLKLPQVVGLTASFPVENANNKLDAASSILRLCANLDASTISVVVDNIKELNKTVAVPTEEYGELTERDNDASYEKIINVMETLEQEAQDCAHEIQEDSINLILSKVPQNRKLQTYNNWAVDLLKESEELPRTEKETNIQVRLLMIIAKYLAKYHMALETHDLVHLEDVISYLDNCFAENKIDEAKTSGETRFYDFFVELKKKMKMLCHEDNPNLLGLMGIIEEKLLMKGSLSRGIIFVRTRAIAEALVSWLNRCSNEEINKLKASVFTGTNAKESQGGMTQSQQNALVEKFRQGKVRILVATSVAEEGMDVPECNLVIKYNHVGNEISTIQTRGRSRKAGGHSILLAMPKICEKERINRMRTRLMYEGIEIVRKMNRQEFSDQVLKKQVRDAEERDIEQMLADQKRKKWKDTKFRLVCKLCRKFCIESKDVRIVCGNHRIAINKKVWNLLKLNPAESRYIDETQIVGSVRCQSQIEDGTKCNSPLGTAVYYSHVYFFAVGIKNVIVEEEGNSKPRTSKKWKDLPYPIEDLSTDDIKRYIMPEEKPHSGVQETESAGGAILSSFAASVDQNETRSGLESVASAFPQETSQISQERFSTADSVPSDYTLDSLYHETERKVLVSSNLDSGVAPASAFDSTQ